mgnify:CR=1 FL=1
MAFNGLGALAAGGSEPPQGRERLNSASGMELETKEKFFSDFNRLFDGPAKKNLL